MNTEKTTEDGYIQNTAAIALALRRFQKDVHAVAVSKGWWDWQKKFPHVAQLMETLKREIGEADPDRRPELLKELLELTKPNIGEKIALVHSEGSEALEAIRAGNPPDDKIPTYSGAEAELADAIIRILDLAEKMNWDVIGAMLTKHDFNKSRAYMHGGKKF